MREDRKRADRQDNGTASAPVRGGGLDLTALERAAVHRSPRFFTGGGALHKSAGS